MERILGLTIGEPYDLKSWSGSSPSLFTAFNLSHKLLNVRNVDLSKVQKILYAIPHFSFNRTKWRQNYIIHPLTFEKRSQNATKITNEYNDSAEGILQIGAMFKVNSFQKPIMAYCDGNLAVSMKAAQRSFTEFVPKKTVQKAFAKEKNVYDNCTLIFTFSEWLRDSMIQDFGISEKKVFSVGAGPNIEQSEAENIQKRYDQKTILFIGKDFYRKGGDTVIKAFRIAAREIPDLRLIVAGPAGEIPGIKTKNIEFAGYIDKNSIAGRNKIIDLYKKASIFVMPSIFEPFGIVFLEAMLFQLPCIGADTCAMPEIIADGHSGFLIKPGDAEELAKKLIIALKDEAMLKSMGEQGFKRVKTYFNWKEVVNKINTLAANVG